MHTGGFAASNGVIVPMKFSIIIPTLNEQKTIASCLLALQPLRDNCEIIIVDATENQLAPPTTLADKIISSATGRARQMNIGASHASGDILIFLHADTYLPEHALQLIEQRLQQQAMGAFRHPVKRRSFHVESYRHNDELALPPDRHCHRRSSHFRHKRSICSSWACTQKSP